MKIKIDFVTNSSSSSFIVTFPHKPEDVYDLMKMMGECNPEEEWYDETFTSDEIARQVWKDLNSKPCFVVDYKGIYTIDDFKEYYERCLKDIEKHGEPRNCKGWTEEDYKKDWEEWYLKYTTHNYTDKYIKDESALDYLEENEDKTFTCYFHYSDGNGTLEASIEHGNIFRNVEYIRINEH